MTFNSCFVVLMLLLYGCGLCGAGTYMFSNGSVALISGGENSDLILSAKGNGKVILGCEGTATCSNAVLIGELKLYGHSMGSLQQNLNLFAGEKITLRAGISGELNITHSSAFLNMTSLSGISIDTQNAGSILLDAGVDRDIVLRSSLLDLRGTTLLLNNGVISGNKINGGVIDATTITTLNSTIIRAGNIDISETTVESTSGDLTLGCPAGQSILINTMLKIDQLQIQDNVISTITNNDPIIIQPDGSGAVRIASGRALDLTGVSLLLDDDTIDGSKIEGGQISNISIVDLWSQHIHTGLISDSGDIHVTPGSGKTMIVDSAMTAQNLKLEAATISTTTNTNLELTAGASSKVVLNSPLELSGSNGISSTSGTFGDLQLSGDTISSINSHDININPAGSKVTVANGKTLDLTDVTILLTDNAISGNKIEGGTIKSINIEKLDVGSPSVAVSSTSTSLKVDGGIISSGTRDKYSYSSLASKPPQLVSSRSEANLGEALRIENFEAFELQNFHTSARLFVGSTFDGRYVYLISTDGFCVQYDTQRNFTDASSYSLFDVSNNGFGKQHYGACFDGNRYIYLAPYRYSETDYIGKIVRYDTSLPFESVASWQMFDAKNITGNNDVAGYMKCVYQKPNVIFAPSLNLNDYHGRVLSYNDRLPFDEASSYTVFDLKDKVDSRIGGFLGICVGNNNVYFAPQYSDGKYHGYMTKYDATRNLNDLNAWTVFDAETLNGQNNLNGFGNCVWDGRYVTFTPFNGSAQNHGRFLRYDSKGNFSSTKSWSFFNAEYLDGAGLCEGYRDGSYDGSRYLYFTPYKRNPGGVGHGNILRFDTHGSFTSSDAWAVVNIETPTLYNANQFYGSSFDGRWVYFLPMGGTILVRYDTESPKFSPGIRQVGTSEAFFVDNVDNIGVGTKQPSSKLHVSGDLAVDSDIIVKGNVSAQSKLSVVGDLNALSDVQVNGDLIAYSKLDVEGDVHASNSIHARGFRDDFVHMSSKKWGAFTQQGQQGYSSTHSFTASGKMTTDNFATYDVQSLRNSDDLHYFLGSCFDGRYVYMIQNDNKGGLLRVDTQQDFNSSSAYSFIDLPTFAGAGAYVGSLFDGKYVYLVSFTSVWFVRYDTQKPFLNESSYELVAKSTIGASVALTTFFGSSFDGRYVYYFPFQSSGVGSGLWVRYDTRGSFFSSASWEQFNVATIHASLNTFHGGTCDGRYVYAASGLCAIVRYEIGESFTSASSWKYFFYKNLNGLNNIPGGIGAVYDGRFIYTMPISIGMGIFVRHDTLGDFTSSDSWDYYDVMNTVNANLQAIYSCSYDGRFLVCISLNYKYVSRYDTTQPFKSASSWDYIDLTSLGVAGMTTSVFDGRYMYLAPFYSRYLLRYDTRAPTRSSIMYSATSADLFMDKGGNVGIGSSSPSPYKLKVAGSVYISGNLVTAGTISAAFGGTCSCSSDVRLKSHIEKMDNASQIVERLRPVHFKWKKTGKPSLGFVAQDVEKVLPQLVDSDPEGFKMIDYSKMVAVMASALQESNEKIASNQKRIEELERKLEIMSKRSC